MTMTGKIVKGIAGFYYVYTTLGLVECRARGVFRKEEVKPLVGDNVELTLISEEELTGNITRILPRKNALIRPASANIDQAMVIFALKHPAINYQLLDKFLIGMDVRKIPTLICFNKTDLVTEKETEEIRSAYEGCGRKLLFVSGREKEGLRRIEEALKGKTTVVAGPSGVGKSTIVNALCPRAAMETGELSKKIGRGKHTTRHAELFALSGDTFLMDTPGFTALSLPPMEKEELKDYFPEFAEYEEGCRFGGCAHYREKDCGVRDAVEEGKLSRIRYEDYRLLYEELCAQKRW